MLIPSLLLAIAVATKGKFEHVSDFRTISANSIQNCVNLVLLYYTILFYCYNTDPAQ
jgi:hypothetical protein